MTNRHWLTWRLAACFTLIALVGAAYGAELSSRPYPPLLAAGGSGDSSTPLVSADGRYVVFVSAAENLAAGDGNQLQDVFVRDRETHATSLLSAHAADSPPGRGHAGAIAISADASLIAYEVTQLSGPPLPGPQALQVTNTAGFLVDRATGLRRSIGIADGLPLPFVSGDPPETNWSTYARAAATDMQFADGGRLFFQTPGQPHPSSPPTPFHLLVELDLMSGNTNLYCTAVSYDAVPTAELRGVRLSADGERAAFFTSAYNLHPLDLGVGSGRPDVFVYDRTANSNILVSIAADGTRRGSNNSEAPDISGDGRFVVFTSTATNLVATDTNHNADVFLRDLTLETTILISSNLAGLTGPASGSSGAPAISRNGRWIAFFSNASDLVADDPNGAAGDVFLCDHETGVVARISNHPNWRGRLATTAHAPQLSFDGSFVLYQAPGSGLFLYERESGMNHRLTDDVTADSPSMSPDGRFVVFSSQPVPGPIGGMDAHRQIYLFDRELDSFELISVRDQGLPVQSANDASRFEAGVVATADDLLLVRSYATDLGLRAEERKLRLWNLSSDSLPLEVDLGKLDGTPIEVPKVMNLTASADGRWLAFDYDEPALGDAYTNSGWHVVLHDRANGVNRVLNRSSAEFDGPHFPAISPDGRRVVWRTSASQLEIHDLSTGDTIGISPNVAVTGAEEAPHFTSDGQRILFRCRGGAIPELGPQPIVNWRLLSLDVAGLSIMQVDPLELFSSAGNVVSAQITLRWGQILMELQSAAGASEVYLDPLPHGDAVLVATHAANPRMGSNFHEVAFESTQSRSGLQDTNNASDVFLTEWPGVGSGRLIEETLVSVNRAGSGSGNGRSKLIGISPDNRFVLFHSWASDLVPNDTNQLGDLFLRDLRTQTTLMLTSGQDYALADGNTSARAMFSRDGTKVIFESHARNLTAGDFNETRDVFTATLSLPDGDGDGMPDSWELTWFGTLDEDGKADHDGDSVPDRDEFVAGTIPVNGLSVLEALTIQSLDGQPFVLWSAVPGRSYRVQYREDFSEPGWRNIRGLPILARDSIAGAIDTTAPFGARRFYRVEVLPLP